MPDLEQNGLMILFALAANYWSSTENDPGNNAWNQNFDNGNQNNDNENNTLSVRAVRGFEQKIW